VNRKVSRFFEKVVVSGQLGRCTLGQESGAFCIPYYLILSSCSQLFVSYFELIFLSDKIKKRRYSLRYIEDFL